MLKRTCVSASVPFVVFCLQALFAQASFADVSADLIWVHKSERKLYLLQDYRIIRSYPVALGKNPQGHKSVVGDSRTPEGLYLIDWRNPNSRFHLSLHISYPNRNDVLRAQRRNSDPGDNVMIHGTGHGAAGRLPGEDWTEGCIALSNGDMEEVWRLVADGTPILIDP